MAMVKALDPTPLLCCTSFLTASSGFGSNMNPECSSDKRSFNKDKNKQ